MSFELRYYQRECVDAVVDAFREFPRVLAVMATGTGKTLVFNTLGRMVADAGGKVLVLVHTDDLVRQTERRVMEEAGIEPTVEKAERKGDLSSWFVVASVKSLGKEKRLERYPVDHFSLVVVDEAHRSLAESYGRIVSRFPNAKVLGVTATPSRGDKKTLSSFYQTVAYNYPLEKAVTEGYLCPVHVRGLPIKVDISQVRTKGDDFDEKAVAEAVDPSLKDVVGVLKEIPAGSRTIVFCPGVACSERLSQLCRDAGVKAAAVSGDTPKDERIAAVDDFKSGKLSVLTNAQVFVEGVDIPAADHILNLRASKSETFVKQAYGRGTRNSPGKEQVVFMELSWVVGKKKTYGVSHLVADDDAMAMEMTQELASNPNVDHDLLAMLACARSRMAASGMDKWRIRAKEFLARRGRAAHPGVAAFLADDMDWFLYEPVFPWERARPTQPQIDCILRAGLDPSQIHTKGEAMSAIDMIVRRSKADLCTFKQMFLLSKFGVVDKSPTFTFEQARGYIDGLVENQWKLTDELRAVFGKSKIDQRPNWDYSSARRGGPAGVLEIASGGTSLSDIFSAK